MADRCGFGKQQFVGSLLPVGTGKDGNVAFLQLSRKKTLKQFLRCVLWGGFCCRGNVVGSV